MLPKRCMSMSIRASSYTPVASKSPAYKEALAFVEKAKAQELEKAAALERKAASLSNPKDAERLAKKARSLYISGVAADPAVRARLRSGEPDLTSRVERLYAEHEFKKGPLAVSLQRIYQMKIIPDLFPYIRPEADLRVYSGGKEISSGSLIPGETFKNSLTVHAQVFGEAPRTYHLLMVTPDVPDPESQSYTQKVHWFVPNIKLSPTETRVAESSAATYTPPLPEPGLHPMRYALILLTGRRHDITLENPDITSDSFSTRAFIEDNGLVPVGVSLFRVEYDDAIGELYAARNMLPRKFAVKN